MLSANRILCSKCGSHRAARQVIEVLHIRIVFCLSCDDLFIFRIDNGQVIRSYVGVNIITSLLRAGPNK